MKACFKRVLSIILAVATVIGFSAVSFAAEDYDNIYVIDGTTAAIGGGILTEYALNLAEKGLSAKEIADEIELVKEKVIVIALVDTLEYLKRGGRISKAAAFAGGILSIKPVICLKDGKIEILGKARGSKQGNNLLVKEIEAAGGVDFDKPLLLGFTGLTDALLNKYIEDSAFLWQDRVSELRSELVGSVIGTHIGPGGIAVAFFKKG